MKKTMICRKLFLECMLCSDMYNLNISIFVKNKIRVSCHIQGVRRRVFSNEEDDPDVLRWAIDGILVDGVYRQKNFLPNSGIL